MRKMIDTKCEGCDEVVLDRLLDPEKVPACECGGARRVIQWTKAASEGIRVQAAQVVGDDIPGGILMEHGICADNGDPIRYYSKTDIRRAAKSKGLIWGGDECRHVTAPKMGTDKNANTVRHVSIPFGLTQELEDERVRAWHEHEEALKKEQESV